ncbi:MAG TPA: copper chaperone PCu(A)C [Allosphingosinicella sp.]|nr:copper chaperone PCu(A)C [Allosphingosinicella sp.]
MMKMLESHAFAAAVLAAALLALPGCDGRKREPSVHDAWVRMPAAKGQPGAAYFRLEGNVEGTRLTDITSPLVRRIELHETVEKNGVTRMEKRRDIEFPYRGALVFEPGGRHAMLFGINRAVKPGLNIPLTFSFNTAAPVTVVAEVRSASGETEEAHKGH